jgi:hypothetical protein
MTEKNSADLNKDGIVSDTELKIYETRVKTQRKLAVSSFIFTIVFTAILMTDIIEIDRVKALSDLFGMFYITMGGIVAAYFGAAAWMHK